MDVSKVNILNSFSDGLSVVAPGSKPGQGTLSNVRLEDVSIPNYGIGTDLCHGLWIRSDARGSLTIIHSSVADIQNNSTHFVIKQERKSAQQDRQSLTRVE